MAWTYNPQTQRFDMGDWSASPIGDDYFYQGQRADPWTPDVHAPYREPLRQDFRLDRDAAPGAAGGNIDINDPFIRQFIQDRLTSPFKSRGDMGALADALAMLGMRQGSDQAKYASAFGVNPAEIQGFQDQRREYQDRSNPFGSKGFLQDVFMSPEFLMFASAVAAPHLAKLTGFGPTGTAATLGGIQGALTGGNPITGAAMSAGMSTLGQQFGAEPTVMAEGGNTMTDVPLVGDGAGSSAPVSSGGELPPWARGTAGQTFYGPASTVDLSTGQTGYVGGSNFGIPELGINPPFYGPEMSSLYDRDETGQQYPTDMEFPEMQFPAEQQFSGTSYSGDQFPTEMQYPDGPYAPPPPFEPGIMEQVKGIYNRFKDPIALGGALMQLYQSRGQEKDLRAYLESERAREDFNAQRFPHEDFTQLAKDWSDPTKRYEMILNNPGFRRAEDYLVEAEKRKLAGKGIFSQVGHGGAVPGRWANQIGDTVAKNMQQWDNQMFGQIKDLTGMSKSPQLGSGSTQLASAFLPSIYSNNQNAWRGVLKAVEKNLGSFGGALESFLN